MADAVTISPELQARVESLAARTHRSPADVVAEALEEGHSLAWQEQFVEAVQAGKADAAAGRYATATDFERLRAKYRQT